MSRYAYIYQSISESPLEFEITSRLYHTLRTVYTCNVNNRVMVSLIVQIWYVEVRIYISKYFRESLGIRDNESTVSYFADRVYM